MKFRNSVEWFLRSICPECLVHFFILQKGYILTVQRRTARVWLLLFQFMCIILLPRNLSGKQYAWRHEFID